MDKKIKELIEMSIIDGKIEDNKLRVIKKKAKELGIDEGELMIYIDHMVDESKNTIQNQISKFSNRGKEEATKQVNALKEKFKDINLKDSEGLINKVLNYIKINKKITYSFVAILAILLIFKMCNNPTQDISSSNFVQKILPLEKKGYCEPLLAWNKNEKFIDGTFKVYPSLDEPDYKYMLIKNGVVRELKEYFFKNERLIIDNKESFDKKARQTKRVDYRYNETYTKIKNVEETMYEYEGKECNSFRTTSKIFLGDFETYLSKKVWDKRTNEGNKYFDNSDNEISWEEYDRLVDLAHGRK